MSHANAPHLGCKAGRGAVAGGWVAAGWAACRGTCPSRSACRGTPRTTPPARPHHTTGHAGTGTGHPPPAYQHTTACVSQAFRRQESRADPSPATVPRCVREPCTQTAGALGQPWPTANARVKRALPACRVPFQPAGLLSAPMKVKAPCRPNALTSSHMVHQCRYTAASVCKADCRVSMRTFKRRYNT